MVTTTVWPWTRVLALVTTAHEKAEERMDRFLRSAGTLLLASHSEDLLRRFCGRGLVFDSGRLVFSGPLEHALAYYHEHHAPPAKCKAR